MAATPQHLPHTHTPEPLMDSAPSPSDSKKRQSRSAPAKDVSTSKKAKHDLVKCPICREHINPSQYESHYQLELQRLQELDTTCYESSQQPNTKGKRGAAVAARKHIAQSVNTKKVVPNLTGHEQTLSLLRKNRAQRKAVLRGGSEDLADDRPSRRSVSTTGYSIFDPDLPHSCFICNEVLHGDSAEINSHIDSCLADGGVGSSASSTGSAGRETRSGVNSNWYGNGPAPDAMDEGNMWEEYEWAGQTRVRVTSLLEGGYRGAGFAIAKKDEDVDDDVDVEDDGAATFGEAQFTEKDILVNEPDEDEESLALREMVSGRSGSVEAASSATAEAATDEDESHPPRPDFEPTVSDDGWTHHLSAAAATDTSGTSHARLVIESLKSRIRQLEASSRAAPKCLICLESYTSPLASVVCWHVHCEQCWLRTLGAKKLCPQCQKITSAADLRRVYL